MLLILVIFAIIRIPLILSEIPLLKTELEWMLVGERMSRGFIVYKDIWTSVSPLSAFIYWLIEIVSTRSQALHGYLSLLISFLIVIYFNNVLINRNAYLEKNYVPALILMLFLHISYDMMKLSPALFSVFFLLMAFNKIIREIEKNSGVSDEIFEVGLYVGIATVLNLPSSVMIIWALLSAILFTGSSFRQYFLLLFGFAIPIFICIVVFYLNDSYNQFSYNWLSSLINVKLITFKDVFSVIIVLILPATLSILGFFRVSVMLRYNSYQTRMQQIMLLWLIVALTSFLFMPIIHPSQSIILCPPFAFFTGHFFLNMKNRIRAELIFTASLFTILFIFFAGIKNWKVQNELFSLENLHVKPSEISKKFENKAILIVGDDLSDYQKAMPATCYLNWDLSSIDLNNPDNYVSIINIFDNFKNDPPTYIIDQKNVIPRIFQRIPELSKKYKLIDKNLYQKISN